MEDNLDQKLDRGGLPGPLNFSGEVQNPARSTPSKGDSANIASKIKIISPDTEGLEHVDTATITKVLVEQAVNVVHESCGLPVTMAAIAGLPGGVLGAG